MKKIIYHFLNWLKLSIIALILLLVILLSALYFVSPSFEGYRHNLEQFASSVMKQPVEIGSVSVGIRGLEPALRLKKVTIFNDSKNKKILQAKELQIGIDLIGSLIKWKVKPGLLLVRGSEVAVYQNKSGKIGLVGASSQTTKVTEDDSVFDEIALWLFEQSRIDLEEIKLKWSLPNGDVIKVNDLYLSLNNGALQHELNLSGNLEQQDYPAKFKANFRLRGDLLKIPSFPLVGDVKILNWSYDLNSSRLSNNHLALPLSGNINLQIKDSKIKTKNFRQPMVINNLGAKVDWQHDGNKLKLNVSKLEFMDDWLSFYGGGQCLFLDNAPLPTVDLKLKFKLINLAKAKLYYPVSVLPSNATAWLDQAFTSSKLLSGNLILQGPLDKFPFDNNEGKFLIESTIRDVYLHYDPDWPLIEKISGKMTFANRSMTILANSAGIMGQPAKFIKAVIPDLDLPFLYIDGAIDTDSSVGLKFVNSSPLKKTVGRKLQDIVLSGPMHFNLTMEMPLSDDVAKKDTQVEGDILLINNLVSSQDLGFNVSSLQGDLHFKDGDLVANNIQGKLFDRLLKLNISTLNPDTDDAITRVSLSGSAMMQDFERAFAVKLSPYMFGDFNFDALLDLYTSSTQNIFKLHSNLLGVGIDLPKPFDKKPDSSYEFDLSCYFGGNKNPQITVNYNNQISAALMVKKDSSGSLKMVGGEVKFGKTPAKVATSTGLVISGSLDELDWSVWKEYLRKAQGNFNAAGSVVRKVSLKIAKLRILGQLFNKISLDAQPKNDGWEIAILMPDIDGKIYFPNNNKKAIKGEFKKLYLNSKKQESLTELKPQDLPPLNFIINNFRYGNKYFNRVIFTSKPWDGGLKFDEIKIIDDGFEIDAGGEWLGVGNNQRSIFRGNVNSKDVGGLLKQLDFTDTMIGGNGGAKFALKWPNAPYKPNLQTLNGSFSVSIKDGRIINLSKSTESKLGFGRLLGILSLQSLPRRLTLDFSDLTQKGFGFDTMDGNFELAGGNIQIKKINLDGPAASVKAKGRVDIKKQDYDITLNVVPKITSSIPVAATIVGGPIVGLLTLVADRAITTVMKKTSIYTYRVTGSWAKSDINVAVPAAN